MLSREATKRSGYQCLANLGRFKLYTPLAEKQGLHLHHYDMRNLRIHGLRLTQGFWLASSGTSLPIIGRGLNHKTPEGTKVYARLSVVPVRNAMDEATSAMSNAATHSRKN